MLLVTFNLIPQIKFLASHLTAEEAHHKPSKIVVNTDYTCTTSKECLSDLEKK